MKVSTPQGPVDMTDPSSIRTHAYRVLIDASTAEDGGAGARIQSAKALLEIADTIEAKQKTATPIRPRMTAAEAAAELRRRIEAGESR